MKDKYDKVNIKTEWGCPTKANKKGKSKKYNERK